MGAPDTTIAISTTKITARNLFEACWDVPYCSACLEADKRRPKRFGWLKSLWSTFTEQVHAVEFLFLNNAAQRLRFENKQYLNLFLQANATKNRSSVDHVY